MFHSSMPFCCRERESQPWLCTSPYRPCQHFLIGYWIWSGRLSRWRSLSPSLQAVDSTIFLKDLGDFSVSVESGRFERPELYQCVVSSGGERSRTCPFHLMLLVWVGSTLRSELSSSTDKDWSHWIGGRGLDLGDSDSIYDDDPSVGFFVVMQIVRSKDWVGNLLTLEISDSTIL